MLSSIVVSNCAALHRINITSNSLQVNSLWDFLWFTLILSSVRKILSASVVVQKLALQKQENLTTLTLQCQCLQEVDLTDCESLTNSICDVFSDGGGCPMLKSLVLDNCEVCESIYFINWISILWSVLMHMIVIFALLIFSYSFNYTLILVEKLPT